jgi:hypothetical protein
MSVWGPRIGLAIGLGFVLAPAPRTASAEEDQQRIPANVLGDEPVAAPAAAAGSESIFVEANGEQVTRRTLLVPIESPDHRREVWRLIADARGDKALSDRVTARLSARFDFSGTQDDGTRNEGQISLREAAAQWRAADTLVAEFGRVNLRQGVALGFNPTDFFKPRTAVDTSTRDPQVQRVNRLGTVMLNAQHIGPSGSLLVALAPRLTQAAGLAEDEPKERLRLGDTNGQNRLLVKGQLAQIHSLQPELLAFKDDTGWRVGANLTGAFGQQVTGFIEYAGGRRLPLLRRLLEDGVHSGDLPASALAALPGAEKRWLNDLAIGATWTGSNLLSLTAEFDLQQGGLSRDDWQHWFGLGTAGADGASLAWYLRGAANAQLEPLLRRNLFLRAQWDQAGLRDLSFNAFVNRNLDDQSQLGQIAVEYRATPSSRLRATVVFTHGRSDSQYGSDPARYAVLLGFVHYL